MRVGAERKIIMGVGSITAVSGCAHLTHKNASVKYLGTYDTYDTILCTGYYSVKLACSG